jgi:hypothetical protein
MNLLPSMGLSSEMEGHTAALTEALLRPQAGICGQPATVSEVNDHGAAPRPEPALPPRRDCILAARAVLTIILNLDWPT